MYAGPFWKSVSVLESINKPQVVTGDGIPLITAGDGSPAFISQQKPLPPLHTMTTVFQHQAPLIPSDRRWGVSPPPLHRRTELALRLAWEHPLVMPWHIPKQGGKQSRFDNLIHPVVVHKTKTNRRNKLKRDYGAVWGWKADFCCNYRLGLFKHISTQPPTDTTSKAVFLPDRHVSTDSGLLPRWMNVRNLKLEVWAETESTDFSLVSILKKEKDKHCPKVQGKLLVFFTSQNPHRATRKAS